MGLIVPYGLFYLCIRSLPVDGKTISAITAKNVAERKTGFTDPLRRGFFEKYSSLKKEDFLEVH